MARSGRLVRLVIRGLDSAASILPQKISGPEHIDTGRKGEEEAYFYLRGLDYVMVARNYRGTNSRGELDLVGWDGETLCFVEVKTRTTHDVKPAEAAVDEEKQRDLCRVAREFLRKIKGHPPFRFDVISVYLEPAQPPQIELFKNAFPMT
jgi:putative endonuclease